MKPFIQLVCGTLLAATPLTGPALAADLPVSTALDIVADDGRCSLREAVTAANTQIASGTTPGECPAGEAGPAEDRIILSRGTYRLTLGARGEDANAGGDLDVIESLIVVGAGARETKIQNAIGLAGDHRRRQPERVGTLALAGGAVRNNRAVSGAGGIHNEGEITAIDGTAFTGNTAPDCEDVGAGIGCL